MEISYIQIEHDDKIRLMKLAQAKQVSLSTLVNIINKNFYYAVNHTEYYKKTQAKYTCLKIRNEIKQPINTIILTNSVYAYLHNEVLKNYPNKDFLKNAKRKIQSELDKTYDPNWLKNITTRALYKVKESRA